MAEKTKNAFERIGILTDGNEVLQKAASLAADIIEATRPAEALADAARERDEEKEE